MCALADIYPVDIFFFKFIKYSERSKKHSSEHANEVSNIIPVKDGSIAKSELRLILAAVKLFNDFVINKVLFRTGKRVKFHDSV